MKSKPTLSELFELTKNAAPVMQVGEIESLTASGNTSPLAAIAAFKPRRILRMFNPTKILIMTTLIVIITSFVLLLNPFGKKTEDGRHETEDIRQKTERLEDGETGKPAGAAERLEKAGPKEEGAAQVGTVVPVPAAAKNVAAGQKDTVFEGEILRLSKEELVKLGFLFDGQGYYYLNQMPDGSKLNFWSCQGPQGGSFGFGAGGVNQSNKAPLVKNDFYPVTLTNLEGEELYPLNTYSKIINKETFERINDTLVPVLFSRQILGGYKTPDQLVWFKVSDDFFDCLDAVKTEKYRKIYQTVTTLVKQKNPANLVVYDYESFFPGTPVIKVKPEVLQCLGINSNSERISFSFQKEGLIYTCWADSSGFGVETMAVTSTLNQEHSIDSLSTPSVVLIETESSGQPALPHVRSGINPEMLVPIRIDNPDASETIKKMVFWIYPNEKTLSCLPPEIAEPMRKEFAYQQKRLNPGFVPQLGGSIGIKGGGLVKDSAGTVGSSRIGVNLKSDSVVIDPDPVPCVYFTNLCESLPGVDYVNLYPNPVTDKLNVDLVLQSAKKIRFRVLDLGGRVITDDGAPESFTEGGQVKHQLDVSKLQNGLYLLLMTDEEGARLTRRFVKN